MAALLEAADELGASVDASADVDHPEIRGLALARHWERLLDLIADIARQPTLPPEEVERERTVIRSGIDSRSDMPLPFTTDTLLVDLYGAHPYAWPATGRRESIARLHRDDLVRHYGAIYRLQDVTLAVSGNVSRGHVLEAVERLFGKWAARSPHLERQPQAATVTGKRRVVEKPVGQAQIMAEHLGPLLGHPDYASIKVLASLLGGGMGSPLFTEIRDRRGLAYAAGVLNPTRVGPSAFMTHVGTAPENVDTVEALSHAEIERVRAEPPSADEVARAKARVLGSLAMDRRTNARQAWHLAFFEVVGAGWDFPQRYARAVEAVTPADVTAAAARWLVRPSTVVVRPSRP
jgi:predicted Zn-dependent peptidase